MVEVIPEDADREVLRERMRCPTCGGSGRIGRAALTPRDPRSGLGRVGLSGVFSECPTCDSTGRRRDVVAVPRDLLRRMAADVMQLTLMLDDDEGDSYADAERKLIARWSE